MSKAARRPAPGGRFTRDDNRSKDGAKKIFDLLASCCPEVISVTESKVAMSEVEDIGSEDREIIQAFTARVRGIFRRAGGNEIAYPTMPEASNSWRQPAWT